MNGREAILRRMKEAVKITSPADNLGTDVSNRILSGIAAITPNGSDALWAQFKKELEAIDGKLYAVKDVDEAAENISRFIEELGICRVGISREAMCRDVAEAVKRRFNSIEIISPEKLNYEERKKEYAVTGAAIVHPAFAVADIGSLVFPYEQTGTSYPHFLCDNIFVVVDQNQIVANQFELFARMDSPQVRNMVFVAGPSRTADIEKVLVLGAHGPRRLVVLKIEGQETDRTQP